MYKSVTTGKALILVPFDMRILLRKVIIDNFIAYINISMTKLKWGNLSRDWEIVNCKIGDFLMKVWGI